MGLFPENLARSITETSELWKTAAAELVEEVRKTNETLLQILDRLTPKE